MNLAEKRPRDSSLEVELGYDRRVVAWIALIFYCANQLKLFCSTTCSYYTIVIATILWTVLLLYFVLGQLNCVDFYGFNFYQFVSLE